ncbi:hypothetical protein VLK31_35945 [Variovorax sp. H27-G14]|uniref:hypothetical protein n=1 Tax=Variovorax sp. H27-G14 TaxID=3111914 RepID=UPI0038FC767A
MIADLVLNFVCYGVGVVFYFFLEVFGLEKRRSDQAYIMAGFLVIAGIFLAIILALGTS